MPDVMTRPNFSRVRSLVTELLSEFGYSEPPVNPVDIARGRGVEVRFVTFAGEHGNRVSGFYDPDEHRIYANAEEYPLRQTFTIAHELGHALLHRDWARSEDYKMMLRDQEAPTGNPHEIEANFFAAHLLVPRFMLDKYVHVLDPVELSRLFAVSVPTVKYRLANEYGF